MHEGELPTVPELADARAAERFYRSLEERLAGEVDGPLCELPSRLPAGRLIGIPMPAGLGDPLASLLPTEGEPGKRRRRVDEAAFAEGHPSLWLGLRYQRPEEVPAAGAAIANGDGSGGEAWQWLLALGGALGTHGQQLAEVLYDPVTELPGRTELQVRLGQLVGRARKRGEPLSVVLVNPDEFDLINERFGREAGDTVLRSVAERLVTTLRRSDVISRYGGAVFAVALPDLAVGEAEKVIAKVRAALTEKPYLDGRVRIDVSCGIGQLDAAEEGDLAELPVVVLRRADRALNEAKVTGGGRTVAWRHGAGEIVSGQRDPLAGIFTANLTKDYRNMLLLWDTIHVVGTSPSADRLAAQVVDRLFGTFRPERMGLLHGDQLETMAGRCRSGEPLELPGGERSVVERARAARRLVEDEVDDRQVYAVPLSARGNFLGCLYLAGPTHALDASDTTFLAALGDQLAVALDRAVLAEREREQREGERRRLQAEIKDLRQAVGQAKLLYCSPAMEELLETVRRVAPTDATVLVTGESGTGKELLGRTIHHLSDRHDGPLVVVDCGAISSSLIESELFGHERGAYTGAREPAAGRLAEARGGTVILDEIGELPLEVQSKLLRFVQERTLVRVGGTKVHQVDARVLAATNRDLAEEVRRGSFRADLYHRLNVVRLEVPPLSRRREDILFLADNFLRRFALQYQKRVSAFTAEAEAALLAHDWPGNVRELQNRILQAVILATEERIGPSALRLAPPEPGEVAVLGGAELTADLRPGAAGTSPSEPPAPEVLWRRLRATLAEQVATAVSAQGVPPLGRWLAEDLVAAGDAVSCGVARRAAGLLGMPESTFRRRLRKVEAKRSGGLLVRTETWNPVPQLLDHLVRAPHPESSDLLVMTRTVLLEEVVRRVPGQIHLGSALMGVTTPTFQRWLEARPPKK